MALYSVDKLMVEARKLAAEYRKTTGKPLGISSEIAKFDAARLMNLELVDHAHSGGYDAIGKGEKNDKLVQIKGRAILEEKKSGQRIGQLKVEQEWDSVMLVMMNDEYEPIEIYEAQRKDLLGDLEDSGPSKRKKRGAMTVAKFKKIGERVWSCTDVEADVKTDVKGGDTLSTLSVTREKDKNKK